MSDSKDLSPVIIYSTTWCAYCKMLKKYLDDKKVAWVEKDIEQDAEANAELMKKIDNDFRGVPVSDIHGTIVLGFDRPSIDAALAQ
jgi:glutaredoxin-like YruB-family protein